MHPVMVGLLILAHSVVLTACEERGVNIKTWTRNDSGSGSGGASGSESQFRASVNVKSGLELHHTFAKLTGVSSTQGATLGAGFPGEDGFNGNAVNVASIFSRVRPLLTINNDLAGLSEFKQLALMKLASGYCHQVACNAAGTAPGASPAYLPNLASGSLMQAFGSGALREAFAASVLDQFWGPADQKELVERSEAITDVADYIGELIQSPANIRSCTNQTVASTQENLKVRSVAKAACTLVLSSLPVTRF